MLCEQCWENAYKRCLSDTSKTQSEHYMDCLKEHANEIADSALAAIPGKRPQPAEAGEGEL